MEQAIIEQQYKGYTIKIYQDDNTDSPRDWSNLGKMICFHRRYELGDKHDTSVEDVQALIKRQDIIWLPLFLYDHSGISMSTSRSYPFNDPWDSGQVGIIYVDKATIRKEYSVKHIFKNTLDKALNCLRGEVETYDKFLTGEVYGYVIEDEQGNNIDSCWGFYDTPQEIIDGECKASVDYIAEHANIGAGI